MSLAAGTRLGPYEIVAPLGAGGMGEVYRARDARLQREVAIKVLPASFAHDATRRARFEREAQAVAALSHANILAIFDTGVHDEHVFAVTELLDGETLRTRLDGGALPVKRATDIATQIARGLAAAHEKGIVHRDLKPENIFLLRNGQVKILDFGLATTITSSSDVTATVAAMTDPGTVMGTVGYMSPEQVRGQTVDARTDLFALGAVLHEMLSGTRAFAGGTPADVATAVLRDELPELSTPHGDLPPALDRIVRHCLERHPGDRFQSARDVVFALETLSGSAVVMAPALAVPSRRYAGVGKAMAASAAAGVVAGVVLTVAAARWRTEPTVTTTPRAASVLRSAIALPPDARLAFGSRLNPLGFDNPTVALSPDGAYLSYVSGRGANTVVSLVELATGQVRTLAGTEGATHSFFSPDSQQIAFLTADRVKRVAVDGGAARTLCEAVRPTLGRWMTDNTVYFSEAFGFAASRVSADGGRPERLLRMGVGRFVSDFLPDGKSLLVTARLGINADHASVVLVELGTGRETPLIAPGFGARFVDGGSLLFGRAGSLLAVRLDAGLERIVGEPVLVADGVAMDALFAGVQAIASGEGLLAFVSGGNVAIGRPAWVDRGGAVEPLDLPPQVYGALALAPNARQVAVQVGDTVDHIWLQNLDRHTGRKLPSPLNAGWPAWSPDGRRLAVNAWPVGQGFGDGSIALWDVEGTAPAQALAQSAGANPGSWSTSGLIAATRWIRDGDASVAFFSPDGARAPEAFTGEFPSISPDGRWVAYTSSETGTGEIVIRSVHDGTIKRQVSTGGGIEPVWSENGELFYRSGRRWYVTRVRTEPDLSWDPDPPTLTFDTEFVDTPGVSYDVSPDGRRLLVVKPAGPPAVQHQISVIANWRGLLK